MKPNWPAWIADINEWFYCPDYFNDNDKDEIREAARDALMAAETYLSWLDNPLSEIDILTEEIEDLEVYIRGIVNDWNLTHEGLMSEGIKIHTKITEYKDRALQLKDQCTQPQWALINQRLLTILKFLKNFRC